MIRRLSEEIVLDKLSKRDIECLKPKKKKAYSFSRWLKINFSTWWYRFLPYLCKI